MFVKIVSHVSEIILTFLPKYFTAWSENILPFSARVTFQKPNELFIHPYKMFFSCFPRPLSNLSVISRMARSWQIFICSLAMYTTILFDTPVFRCKLWLVGELYTPRRDSLVRTSRDGAVTPSGMNGELRPGGQHEDYSDYPPGLDLKRNWQVSERAPNYEHVNSYW